MEGSLQVRVSKSFVSGGNMIFCMSSFAFDSTLRLWTLTPFLDAYLSAPVCA